MVRLLRNVIKLNRRLGLLSAALLSALIIAVVVGTGATVRLLMSRRGVNRGTSSDQPDDRQGSASSSDDAGLSSTDRARGPKASDMSGPTLSGDALEAMEEAAERSSWTYPWPPEEASPGST
jgi:hypothetical protein